MDAEIGRDGMDFIEKEANREKLALDRDGVTHPFHKRARVQMCGWRLVAAIEIVNPAYKDKRLLSRHSNPASQLPTLANKQSAA
jgi:hypothetical protein